MGNWAHTPNPGKRVLLHVGGGSSCFARCDVAIYDSTHREHLKTGRTFAVLVPPGQELGWIYATPDGNQLV